MAQSPVPSRPELLIPWAQNMNLKIPSQGVVLGYSAAEIAAVQNDCMEAIYLLLSLKNLVKAYAKEITAYVKMKMDAPVGTVSGPIPAPPPLPALPAVLVPAGIMQRLRTFAADVKNKANYTPAIGADLDILVARSSKNPAPPKLILVSALAGHVTFKWSKQGWTGIKIQSRKPGDAAWTDLGFDLFSPWVDKRPLAVAATPEVREYRVCHLDRDTPLDNWSPAYQVTVTP